MTKTEKTTAEIIQSAVNFKEEFKKPSKPRKQKQDPNAPYVRPKLIMPNDHKKLLLHTCCAPCAGEIIAAVMASDVEFTIFFYNPNIHPHKEYLIRKDENKRFADKHNIPFIDADYDRADWFERVKGLEHEPERGARCTKCFDMRLERTALYAHENGFPVIATSLGISRWKNQEQVYDSGRRAASRYEDVIFWDFNWRKDGGSARSDRLRKEERFYKQEYCGCVYSLRDANQWRESRGLGKIEIGKTFYSLDD
ncbi:epoxyqueuosine reductase QueH [Actinobacillus porcinus]|uniref:epoxyqueuosine reductase QueH n=1 Tax=Actinobacillus porcinus TaxID=51048 RepID=UPI0023537997|nr:epoxyqueuosine reductase QueH [Actinobacillus porcinus]